MYRFIITIITYIIIIPIQSQAMISLSLDYLYWRPCSDGFFVTIKETKEQVAEDEPLQPSHIKESIKLLSHDGSSGFRLAGALCMPYTCAEVYAQWTYYSPNDSRKIKESVPDLIPFTGLPISGFSGGVERANEVKGAWDLDLNVVDIAIAQSWNWLPLIYMRPHIGLRYASIDQRLKIDSEGNLFPASEFTPPINIPLENEIAEVETKERIKQDYWGIGPTVGLEGRLSLICGIGIYGKASGSFLYGDHDVSDKATLDRFNTVDPFNPTEEGEDLHLRFKRTKDKTCLRANTSLELGLFWHLTLLNGTPSADIKLGWEMQHFYNQNIVDLNPNTVHFTYEGNDLILQGLVLSFAVNF